MDVKATDGVKESYRSPAGQIIMEDLVRFLSQSKDNYLFQAADTDMQKAYGFVNRASEDKRIMEYVQNKLVG